MKLRTKIIVSAISLMLVFALIFSLFILWQSRRDTIRRVEELQINIFELSVREINMSIYSSINYGTTEAIRRDIVMHHAKNNLIGTYAIYENDQELYNATDFEFTRLGQQTGDEDRKSVV